MVYKVVVNTVMINQRLETRDRQLHILVQNTAAFGDGVCVVVHTFVQHHGFIITELVHQLACIFFLFTFIVRHFLINPST